MAKTFDEVVYSLCKTYADQAQLGFKTVKQVANGFEIEYVNGTKATYTVQNMHQHTNMAVLNVLNKDADGDLTFNGKKITNLTKDQETLLMKFSLSADNKLLFDGKEITPEFLDTTGDGTKFLADDGTYKKVAGGTGGASYDDTEVRQLIDDNKTDISTINTKIGNTTLPTTATDITGAIKEVDGNLLGTVSFSADYKNIVLNRKNGTNPYTIPISAIINNAKLIELGDIDTADIGNGKTLVYDAATQKHKYVDSTGTDELVKMDSTGDAHYLADLLDKQTIINDNGTLKVKKLDGQEVTITEINYLKGLTMNVMDLVNMFSNGGVKIINTPVNTYAELLTFDKTSLIDNISYLIYVLADETHDNAKTTYLIDKTTPTPTYFGFAGEHRDFTTNPINLASEVTGKLGTANIDVDALWALLTIDDTYKTLTTTNNAFGTHGAKAMYDELVAGIGAKANQTDFDTHKDDTTIHISSDERTKWNDTAAKVDGAELVKKADIKTTTLDENAINDDIYGGKAIYDAIKANCVGKETVLYDKVISTTGTYTLNDDVNNYDLIIINHNHAEYNQAQILNKKLINKCIDSSNTFFCVFGDGGHSIYMAGYFNNDKIIISKVITETISSIVGYKFGQVTVQNTITNPSPAASYSTDEQLTGGTWIDGKPIYRKTVDCGQLPNTTTKSVAHGITNIGVIINSYGVAFNPSTNTSQRLPFVSPSSTNCITFYYDTTKIYIETGMDRSSFKKSYITLEYTKTTD